MIRNIASRQSLMIARRLTGKDLVHPTIESNPPRIHLLVRSTDGRVFNPISNMYDTMPLNMYFSCGWFPKKISEKEYKDTQSLLTIELDMEFYGDRACRLHIPNYIWPPSLIPCQRTHCPHVSKANDAAYAAGMGFNHNYGW